MQREILSKDLDKEATIKSGLAIEQSNLKLEGLNAGKTQVEEVKSVNENKMKKKSNLSCNTCSFLMHAEEKCPAKVIEYFSHGRLGISV